MTDQITAEEVRQHVIKLKNISTLSTVATRVIELVGKPSTSARDLGKIISVDQALTARVLKMANSPYYGFPKEISTINLAVVVLGQDVLRDLVVSTSILDQFNSNSDGKEFNIVSFWEHSLATGVISQHICKKFSFGLPGEAFVAGLLHDIGKLILNQEFPDVMQKIITRSKENPELELDEIEKELCNCTHYEIGGWLTKKWNFPEQLQYAVSYHHDYTVVDKHEKLVKIIQIADLLSSRLGYAAPLETKQTDDKLKEILSEKELVNLVKIAELALSKSQSLFENFNELQSPNDEVA
jgi:putative nucleotidyltransferase with HDIG domain